MQRDIQSGVGTRPHAGSRIGRFRRDINVSEEYLNRAKEDETVALRLTELGNYRHALYFVLQAMEKYLRSKIFSLVNPNNEYFRQRNRNHSIEEAMDFLVEVISTDAHVQLQIRGQLTKYALANVKYNLLHNDLRYPTYFAAENYSCSLEISRDDVITLLARLNWIKEFMKSL
jgi:HEPN domain-containing protein